VAELPPGSAILSGGKRFNCTAQASFIFLTHSFWEAPVNLPRQALWY
jgi:hypothetical protein